MNVSYDLIAVCTPVVQCISSRLSDGMASVISFYRDLRYCIAEKLCSRLGLPDLRRCFRRFIMKYRQYVASNQVLVPLVTSVSKPAYVGVILLLLATLWLLLS